jgi:hypothetical protein
MAVPTPPSAPGSTPALRGLVLRLVLSVVALDAVAIALFYALDVATAGQRLRSVFVIVWVTVTLVVCSYFLRRIRLHRRGWTVKSRV